MARRGVLRRKIPAGYVRDEERRSVKDPDERVRAAVDHFFAKFDEVGSVCALVRYYHAAGLLFPRRNPRGRWDSPVEWKPLEVRHATEIVNSPFYAGAYFYGACRAKTTLDPETKTRRTVMRRQAFDSWEVVIQNTHPAYISWDVFMRNRERLKQNRFAEGDGTGAARSGANLLQGIAYCFRCGRRLRIHFWGPRSAAVYHCHSPLQNGSSKYCMSVTAAGVDTWVEEQILEAIRPAGIEAAMAAVEELEKRSKELRRQWEHRITECEYEAELACRRYKAVDPANRLVASNLEKDWEEKLGQVEEAKKDYAERSTKGPMRITAEDRERVHALAKDIPRLWRSKTTKQSDRKRIVRILIREVWLDAVVEPRSTKVKILWKTGAVTEAVIDRPWPVGVAGKTPEEVVEAVRELETKGLTCQKIAEQLNKRGLRPRLGEPRYTRQQVRYLLKSRKLGRYREVGESSEGTPMP
jgi:hypothetical protein